MFVTASCTCPFLNAWKRLCSQNIVLEMLEQLEHIQKPVIAAFLGGDPSLLEGSRVVYAEDLEQAAVMAVQAAKGQTPAPKPDDVDELTRLARGECEKLASSQKKLRGLYSGGTLCYETMLVFRDRGINAWSNIALDKALLVEGSEESKDDVLLDMGEDFFTNGMPHPMIDFRQRTLRMEKEAADPSASGLRLRLRHP